MGGSATQSKPCSSYLIDQINLSRTPPPLLGVNVGYDYDKATTNEWTDYARDNHQCIQIA